eukprot:CAMPEP_0172533928 /NCGR_PEP_ID=MMETSP1067-20121228/6477_1 /TAXON_ID=265564 ORGANISM="Thalassiosira punctigera, Strain Tpunct2005C2" /NCGR_SAMPLE_ID=MMETSP1067 /ASSEMBLY_ACC=CAM_ASM_000444 /LENGTH=174 /DNA_ID=CAMNT_0013318649 /DNA_START=101 /DNA_END=625 /DNA_ORIENTATION=+
MDTFRKQEALKPYFDQSYGCAAFSSVAKGGLFIVGGAYGAGDIYKLADDGTVDTFVCKVDLVQAVAGAVLGGEVYSEIVFFDTEADYDRFMTGNFEFSANVKAVVLTASAEANATTMGNKGLQAGLTTEGTEVTGVNPLAEKPEYTKGMKVFTLSLGGFMYQATVGGQKFIIKK